MARVYYLCLARTMRTVSLPTFPTTPRLLASTAMVVELGDRGLIRRQPGQPRSIELLVPADAIPPLL